MNKKELCAHCGKNEAGELQSCPYSEEICESEEELCNCCKECYQECLNNI